MKAFQVIERLFCFYLYRMSSRYFINLAYNGTDFCGWQIQPNDPSVQETIQSALATLYNRPVKVIGCGRTDTGVHASDFYAHADLEAKFTEKDLRFKLNTMLPKSINIKRVFKVDADHHARFDANSRTYIYQLSFVKDPFHQDTYYKYDQAGLPDLGLMNEAASLLTRYNEFFPFCKTHADNETYLCDLSHSCWTQLSDHQWHYKITANRFLRGMVRMIVGMTINVGLGRISLEEVKAAMEDQSRLVKAWSVPAQGLFLSKITYPFIDV